LLLTAVFPPAAAKTAADGAAAGGPASQPPQMGPGFSHNQYQNY